MTDESTPPGETPETGRGVNRPHWTSHWRAHYRPGSWLVLSGPTSLVMLQPAAPQWSELINTVWEDLLAAASIEELAATLAEFRLNEMPDLAVLFWGPDGMRSLVRGRVSIRDPRSDIAVANGEGIQTWTEIGLAALETVRITPEPQVSADQRDSGLKLPLVVGAAQAGDVVLDASTQMRIASPQGTYVPGSDIAGADEAGYAGSREGSEPGVSEPAVSEPGVSQAPEPKVPDRPDRSTLAILRPSAGPPTEVDRPVLIGRAPAAKRVSGDDLPHLVTVTSPSQDISRTHVQVKPENGQVMVYDMHSTNGTSLVHPDGGRRDLPPGQGIAAGYGTVIDVGDGVTVAIDRPDPQ